MTIEHVFLRKSRELLETYTRVLLYRPEKPESAGLGIHPKVRDAKSFFSPCMV
jgi:hypothetical protein